MNKIRTFYRKVAANALYRNSLFLVGSSAILSGCGFIFWLVCARFYTPFQIGQATAFISLMNLIASFSILGIGNTLMRYLATSEHKNEKLSMAFLLTGIASLVLYAIYVLGIHLFTPSLAYILQSTLYIIVLCIGILVSTYNVLFDSVFIAYRSANYTLIKNTLMSVGKIVFPLFLLTLGGFGIVAAVIVATSMSVLFSFVILRKKFNFAIVPHFSTSILRQMWRYSFGNYVANFVTTLPTYLLPIYVLNKVGTSESAYYYVSYMIANLLYTIPFSVSNSLVAEGSFNLDNKISHIKRSIKATLLLLVPAILGVLVFGKYILLAFGKTYSSSGLVLLYLLSFASIFIAINSICVAILRIEERIKALLGYSVILSVSTIGLSVLLTPYKLTGIGIAFLLATAIGCVYNAIVVAKPYKKK